MMRNKGHRAAEEYDAFFRPARRNLAWHRGQLRRIKRRFRKRERTAARRAMERCNQPRAGD
jgi:hypothetical protein